MGSDGPVWESKTYQKKLLIPGTNKRKFFGVLEKPNLPPSVPNVTYKIFLCGKTASGKTWTMNCLSGQEVPSQHVETIGVQCSHVFWPMKIGSRLILFRLELWDAGEASTRQYSHILPACREAVDAVLVCCSASDREGWLDMPRAVAEATQPADRAAVAVVLTRWDQFSKREITEAEVEAFEKSRGVPVVRLGGTASDPTQEMTHIAPTLNFLCRRLWQRDQELLSIK